MDITVIGSCNTDLISYVSRLPKLGETVHGTKFSTGFGGKGANQCVAAARLGAKTAMVAKVGDDTFGHGHIKNFKDNGVNTDHVGVTKEAMTGAAPITVNEQGENAIVIVPGANMLLNEADLTSAEDVIAGSKIVVCQLEVDLSTTLSALKLARKHGVKTILNTAPAQTGLSDEFINFSDILCANESEAELLLGHAVGDIQVAEKAAVELLSRGCKVAIITMGEQGSVYATQDQPKSVHIPADKIKTVDSTGAGDCYVGVLAYFLSTRPDLGLEEAIRRATVVSTISVQYPGTQTSYPWRKDLPESLFI